MKTYVKLFVLAYMVIVGLSFVEAQVPQIAQITSGKTNTNSNEG